MRKKIINRCLDIIRRVVATHNIGGLSYVEEALRQELEKNEFRAFAIRKAKEDGNSC